MQKINRQIEYALIALKHMNESRPGELTRVKDLSLRYQMPFHLTSRVLQKLALHGLLRSEQGAQGGYQIQRDLAKTSLFQLTEMLLGPVEIANCLLKANPHCEIAQNCTIISPILALNERMVAFYKGITLNELLDERRKDERRVRSAASTTVLTLAPSPVPQGEDASNA